MVVLVNTVSFVPAGELPVEGLHWVDERTFLVAWAAFPVCYLVLCVNLNSALVRVAFVSINASGVPFAKALSTVLFDSGEGIMTAVLAAPKLDLLSAKRTVA